MISVTVVGAQTSGNLGAIARVMKNFKVKRLFLFNPECEVLNGESRARAMHAVNVLENAEIISDLSEVGADYLIATSAKTGTATNLKRVYLTPSELKEHYDAKLHYSIVLGREDKGLFNEELSECDLLVHILTNPNYKTLNISHALTIILYELFKGERKISHLASKSEKRAVLLRLRSASEGVENFENFKEIFENLMNRAFIRKKEARALAGLFKNMK